MVFNQYNFFPNQTRKWSFPLRISWVNATNSAWNCWFGRTESLMENFIFCAVPLNKYLSREEPIYSNNVNLISKTLKNLFFPTHTWYLSLFFYFFEFSASLLQKLWKKRNLPLFTRINVVLVMLSKEHQNKTGGGEIFYD